MVHITSFETLDEEIEDEYDMNEMEGLEILASDDDFVVPEPVYSQCYWLTNPAFRDISAWNENRPNNDFLGYDVSEDNELYLGRIWTEKESAIETVELYSIEKRVEFRRPRSNNSTVDFVCKAAGQNCPWKVRIKQQAGTSYWYLSKYAGDHTCNRNVILCDNIHLSAKIIAKHFGAELKERLRLDVRQIQARVHTDFGYEIKYIKAWQAKQIAMATAFGTWKESFAKLPQLMEVIVAKNFGTFVQWETTTLDDGYVQIDRVFWAFGASIRAFEHCRPVLCVDGTHLYGKYNGTLLVAIAIDADNQLVPIAFALVESENTSSWTWFMSCIRAGVTNRDGLCVISDRHKGIIAAMSRLEEWTPPRAYHRYCLRHLKSNFNKKLDNSSSVLKKELGRIGYIADPTKFEKAYESLLSVLEQYPNVRSWLIGIPLEKWSLAHDEGRRWGAMTTNASECFNNILKGARDLPICALVKFTFMQTNEYFVTRRDMYKDYHSPFAPMIDVKLQELGERGNGYRSVLFDRENMIVQVQVGGIHNYYEVNMSERTCSCGNFLAYHYPCSHALRVCRDFRLDIEPFVPHEYTLDAYNLTWAPVFNMIPPETNWPPYEGWAYMPNPRFRRTAKGRPPTRRIHNEMDWPEGDNSQSQDPQSGEASTSAPAKRTQRCKTCGISGHNSRSCPVRNMS